MSKERREGEMKLTHRIHTRITRKKYEELSALLKQSRSQHSLSELLRHILDNRKIVVDTYDTTKDKTIAELAGIRKEIQAIGINLNQVTHRFHTEDLPEARLMQALEIIQLYQQAEVKLTGIIDIISKIPASWLPG